MEKITFNFQNRIALITGGAQGFGLDIAKRFLKSGAKVIIWDIDTKMLKKAIKEIDNPNLSSNNVDVSNFKEVESNVNDIIKNSNIDILINNAGITGPTAALWEYDVETWKKVVEINLMGTFNCCKTIVPNMIKNNYGRIVNVASVAGKDGNANASAYSVGKAGIIGLTKSLGKELADKNIAVNTVTPAGANTRILDQMTKEHVQRMLSKVPRGRFLEVEEFTSLVCWLSSEENTFSTAAVFDISGGRSTY
jgi:3-oxoacyl-[acyl-carrier protein] reductase